MEMKIKLGFIHALVTLVLALVVLVVVARMHP